MSASATPESLNRHARNINPTEIMLAIIAAIKVPLPGMCFSEFITLALEIL